MFLPQCEDENWGDTRQPRCFSNHMFVCCTALSSLPPMDSSRVVVKPQVTFFAVTAHTGSERSQTCQPLLRPGVSGRVRGELPEADDPTQKERASGIETKQWPPG